MTPNINNKYIKVKEGDRINMTTLKMTARQEIDNLVETETHHTDVEEILVEIIDKIIEGYHGTIIEMSIERQL